MSVETSITEISLDQLDDIFKENSEALPTADSLSLGKQEEPIVDDNAPVEDNKYVSNETGLEEIDVDTIDINTTTTNTEGNSEVLKNTLDYLINEGIWVDFEGRDTLDINSETWAEIANNQAQNAAYEMFNELLDETGEYGKAIISYIKEGGNPNEIIDIFKEQKSIESIDTSTESGKQVKIEQYYKDVLGWKEERINKHINRLIENDEVDEEFETIDEAYQKYYKDKISETQQKQNELKQKQIDIQKQFVNSIKNVLDENSTLTNKDKQIIASSILDFKHTLDNGQKVNDFYLKFADVQKDPKEYVELVQFIMDKKGYLERIKQKETTVANKKVFNFIKGNRAIDSVKSTDSSENKKSKGTDFSFFVKK